MEDIIIHKPIRPDTVINTRCRVVELAQRRRGSISTYRFDHSCINDDQGDIQMITSWNTSYWRGVDVDPNGPGARTLSELMPPPVPQLGKSARDSFDPKEIGISVGSSEGVLYGECSRIWNPIHSDAAVAHASGLPAPILHGTATMAKCVTEITTRYGQSDASRVKRVRVARFAGIVLMPSTVTLRILGVVKSAQDDVAIHYEAVDSGGQPVIVGGLVVLSRSDAPAKL